VGSPNRLHSSPSSLPQLPSKTLRKSALSSAIVCALWGAAITSPLLISEATYAQTAEAVMAFNIPADTLTVTLNRFGRDAGIMLSFSTDLTSGVQSKGIKGNYTVNAGLKYLLAGTGLEVIEQRNGGYTVAKKSDNAVGVLSPITVNGSEESITVVGNQMSPYIVTDAPSTTRSNVSIMETSRSIQVIDRDFIDDADIQSLEEALQYVSGTSRRQRLGGVDSQYYVRGFKESDTYRNGKREMAGKIVNMNTIETVEVLKGPSSVRFGVNSPGGIVNYTTKKPEAEEQRSIKVRVDEYGKREVIADFTGATNESGNVLYRLIAAGENSESFRDFSDRKTLTIAPSFTFLLSDKTQLTAAYELHHTELPIDRGIPIGKLSDGSYALADVPIDRKFSEPGDNSTDDTQTFDVTLSHQINAGWQGEISYSYQSWDNNWSDVQNEGFDGFDIETGSMDRGRYGFSNEQETHQGSALLHGDFELMSVRHKVTLGADYSTSEEDGIWGEGAVQPSDEFPSIFNIYAPVYGELSTGLTPADYETATTDTRGLFISETAYLGDSLIMNLAGRYDYYDSTYLEEYPDNSEPYSSQTKDEAFTWNAGLLYKVVPAASIYLSYATSYEPNSASDDLVGELKPQEGEQLEVGIKGLAMNETLQYSLVFYDVTKSNIPNRLRDSDGSRIVKLIGEQTHRGVELDTTWQVTDGFSLLASYSYIDAEISKNDADPESVGNTPQGVPEHSAALFMSYALTPLVSGLSVMGGVNYVDEVPNREDNKFMIQGSTVYDLGLKYTLPLAQDDALLMQAGIKNLTDERVYIQQGHDEVGIGQPRTLYANLEYQF